MWSSPIVTAAPAAEPVLLAKAKQFLRIEDDWTDYDDQITAFIAGVRADVEDITSSRLITQSVDVFGTFRDFDLLPLGPVQSVDAIAYYDRTSVLQTLDEGSYQLVGAGLDRSIIAAGGVAWPSTAHMPAPVKVSLTVGYGAAGSDVPQALYVAMLRAIRAQMDDVAFDLASTCVNHRL